ncbi:hypothetical protein DPMN_055940 [Dreissena polymorpha]|uniref:Serpin domain-containing protein n=2 Tax=Dreissena polymorpha TaxID=45954 RepID=A0A9D4CRM6_DREPO|nr:hypothetical protein DPMN_055940 [Dreissena polymorpha]
MGKEWCVSKVLHKALVDVNEEGTEAAAATAAIIRFRLSMPASPRTFTADHPFMFMIWHYPLNSSLFIGRFTGPTSETAKTRDEL